MKKIFSLFRGFQWKLTVSYTISTVGTFFFLFSVLIVGAYIMESQVSTRTFDSFFWSKTGFQDNIPYLLDDQVALSNWLARVQSEGFKAADLKSYSYRESLDYANTLVAGDNPIFVIDPELNLIAAAPLVSDDMFGKPIDVNDFYGWNIKSIVDAALIGNKDYYSQSILLSDGSYLAAMPLRKNKEAPLSAVVIYQIKPVVFITPSNLSLYLTVFSIVAMIFLFISVPVGAIFGWLVSRGFRERVLNLSSVSKKWSLGDFSSKPIDRSGDEISNLTQNLNIMVEQIESLMLIKDELIRSEERNRLARELHDTVKQQTYASRMQLTAAKNLLKVDAENAAEHIDTALQINRETQQELKQIIEELHPTALVGEGLIQAIKRYVQRWQKQTGIRVDLKESNGRPLPFQVEKVLYRVLQEALSNVIRHANADKVKIQIKFTEKEVELIIKDNGNGFNPEITHPGTLGLIGMKQRVNEIRGRLYIESDLRDGTKISAYVPLD